MALSPGRLSLGYLARAVTPTAADGLDNFFAVIAYGAQENPTFEAVEAAASLPLLVLIYTDGAPALR